MYKNIGKTFLILPFVGYHYFAQLYAGPNDWTVTVLLRGVVFGSVSDTDFTSVVIIIEHLLYLLLFHLLFGTFISRHFMYVPAYSFSRVYGRQRWRLRQSLYLFFYGMWYVFLFLGGHLIGCIWKSAWEPDAETYRTFWIMYVTRRKCAAIA